MTLLAVENLSAGYGPITVLRGLSFTVDEGEACVILGANGAGKTTIMRALSGLIRSTGNVFFDARNIINLPPEAIARLGIAHVPQGRGTFKDLTVDENLRLGAIRRSDRDDVERDRERVLELFPRLRERLRQQAGHLSGGEQQMLAIGRALLSRPRLLLLDEPSLGLSPKVVREVYGILGQLRRELSLTMLIVEQNAALALSLVDRAYVLEVGHIVANGPAKMLAADESIRRVYLGA